MHISNDADDRDDRQEHGFDSQQYLYETQLIAAVYSSKAHTAEHEQHV